MCQVIKRKSAVSRHDAGWAWVIMLTSFTAQLIIDGTLSGFGVFFVAMQSDEAFIKANHTRTELAISGSIQTGFFLCTGAFASPFIQRFGFRIVGSLGSFLVSFGLALASIQTNLHLFNILYGVVTGSGFGIMMVCAIVSVNFYFERYRGVASGVAMSGAGVGYLTIPLLLSLLVNHFGWRMALLGYAIGAFPVSLLSMLAIRPFVLATLDEQEDSCEEKDGVMSVRDQGEQPTREEQVTGKIDLNQGRLSPVAEVSQMFSEDNYAKDVSENPIPNQPQESPVDNVAEIRNGSLLVGPPTTDKAVLSKKETNRSTAKSTGNHELSDMFIKSIRDYLIKQPRAKPQTDSSAEILDEEFGSTVGSRLWRSTQLVKHKSNIQRQQADEQMKYYGSGDLYIQPYARDKKTVRRRRRIVLDPFEQLDIFFSANLTQLDSQMGTMCHKPSGKPSSVIHSLAKLDLGPQELSFLGSCLSVGKQKQAAQPNESFHSSHVSFTASLDRPNELTFSCDTKQQDGHSANFLRLSPVQDIIDGEERFHMTVDILPRPTVFHRLRHQLIILFDLRLFRTPSFLFILMIGITNQLAYFIPFVYLVEFALSKGISRSEAMLLLVIMGSVHTLGRVIAGCAANISWFDTVYVSGLGTLGVAIFNLLLPLAFPIHFAWYAVYAAFFGFFCALPIPMIHILLVRFLGLERLTGSYSNLNLIKGIASVIGPLAAVNLVEKTGQTDHYFYVAGGCFFLSALAHFGLCRFPCSAKISDNGEDIRANCCGFCSYRLPEKSVEISHLEGA